MENFNENDGRWVTLDNGQKVFIREGESFRDAYKRKMSMQKNNNKSLRSIISGNKEDKLKEEQKKLENELSDLLKGGKNRDMDYGNRKIKITNSMRQLSDKEEERYDYLYDRLNEIDNELKKYKR